MVNVVMKSTVSCGSAGAARHYTHVKLVSTLC